MAGFREARDKVGAEMPSGTKVVIEKTPITTDGGDPTERSLTVRSS